MKCDKGFSGGGNVQCPRDSWDGLLVGMLGCTEPGPASKGDSTMPGHLCEVCGQWEHLQAATIPCLHPSICDGKMLHMK